VLHLLVNCLSHLEPVGTASLLLKRPETAISLNQGEFFCGQTLRGLTEAWSSRMPVSTESRSSALEQGRWDRRVARSAFGVVPSMARTLRVMLNVVRGEGTVKLR